MQELTFAFVAEPGDAENEAVLLVSSIRAFAGRFAHNAIWVLVPPNEAEQLSAATRQRLADLDATLQPFAIDPTYLSVPFGAKTLAAAAAEKAARGQAEVLVWMDRDSLVLTEPASLLLPAGKSLGYRPVDHTLIGSSWRGPVDRFWKFIYRRCDVTDDRLFPMKTGVDQQVIRPYFNAGMLAVRPERGLLQAWATEFKRLCCEEFFEEFYAQDRLYLIFMHQAVLAGVILETLRREHMAELPHQVNYPLHMHADYPAERRLDCLNEAITCRYDTLLRRPGWRDSIEIREPLASWLDQQLIGR